jgi:hypothetical protein
MELAGQFFLCMPASPCLTSDGRQGVMFALREPAPAAMLPNGLLAVWPGDEAIAFQREHGAELRPGRGLQLSLQRLVARDGEIRARVLACSLLPLAPSWQRALAPTQQQPTPPAEAAQPRSTH